MPAVRLSLCNLNEGCAEKALILLHRRWTKWNRAASSYIRARPTCGPLDSRRGRPGPKRKESWESSFRAGPKAMTNRVAEVFRGVIKKAAMGIPTTALGRPAMLTSLAPCALVEVRR